MVRTDKRLRDSNEKRFRIQHHGRTQGRRRFRKRFQNIFVIIESRIDTFARIGMCCSSVSRALSAEQRRQQRTYLRRGRPRAESFARSAHVFAHDAISARHLRIATRQMLDALFQRSKSALFHQKTEINTHICVACLSDAHFIFIFLCAKFGSSRKTETDRVTQTSLRAFPACRENDFCLRKEPETKGARGERDDFHFNAH